VSVDLSLGRYDGPGTTHVIFVLYLYDATFIFQEPLRVHVITSLSSSTLRVLTDVTKRIQEEDLVQFTLECPNLDFPIRLPFMQMNQLTSELLLSEIERVLQSNEQFVLDHTTTLSNRIPLFVSVALSFGRYDGPGTTPVIFVLYLDDATFIFQEPLRVHVEFYSKRSSYPRRVGAGIAHQGGSTSTSMWNRRCKNVSTIPGRISDTCDIERAFQRNWTIMAYVVASVFFFDVITFVAVCTEVVTTQERNYAGNHISFQFHP
jgi:hypothetical protein